MSRFYVAVTHGHLSPQEGRTAREPGVTASVLDRALLGQEVARYRSEEMRHKKTTAARRRAAIQAAEVHAAGLNGGSIGKPPPAHGTPARYRKHRCRCPWCRQANTEECRKQRAAMRARGWQERKR